MPNYIGIIKMKKINIVKTLKIQSKRYVQDILSENSDSVTVRKFPLCLIFQSKIFYNGSTALKYYALFIQ